MIQAAAAGIVDFSSVDLFDHRWWLYLHVMLGEVERRNCEAWESRSLDFYRSKLLVQGLADNVFQDTHDNMLKALDRVFDLLFPWTKRENERERGHQIEALKEGWEAEVGDLSDPEVQQRQERIAKAMLERVPTASAEQQRLEAAQRRFSERKKALAETIRKRQDARRRKAWQGGL